MRCFYHGFFLTWDVVIKSIYASVAMIRDGPRALFSICEHGVHQVSITAVTGAMYLLLELLFASYWGCLILLVVQVWVCYRCYDFVLRLPFFLSALPDRFPQICSQLWQKAIANERLKYVTPVGVIVQSLLQSAAVLLLILWILCGQWFFVWIEDVLGRYALRVESRIQQLEEHVTKSREKSRKLKKDNEMLRSDNNRLQTESEQLRTAKDKYHWKFKVNKGWAKGIRADNDDLEKILGQERINSRSKLSAQARNHQAELDRVRRSAEEQRSSDAATIESQKVDIAFLEVENKDLRDEQKVPTNCEEHAKVIVAIQQELNESREEAEELADKEAAALDEANKADNELKKENKARTEAEYQVGAMRTRLFKLEADCNVYREHFEKQDHLVASNSENIIANRTLKSTNKKLKTDLAIAWKALDHCKTPSEALSLALHRIQCLRAALASSGIKNSRTIADSQPISTIHNCCDASKDAALAEALSKIADLEKKLSVAQEKDSGLYISGLRRVINRLQEELDAEKAKSPQVSASKFHSSFPDGHDILETSSDDAQ
ncbi:MAG: hypothetical protein Q9224_006467, partial [Gallowayella concinna]